ncbi:flagellar filament capping protein FliD, partial [Thermodesulfobacteriota bacterium]
MSLSTFQISGLASGFDWRTMVDQLIQVEYGRVELIEKQQGEYEEQLSEWQSFNTQMLSLKSTAGALKDTDDFNLFSSSMTTDDSNIDASDLMSVSTSSSSSPGSYSIQITNLAKSQKLSSSAFSDFSDTLGSDYVGDIIINGTAISITDSDGLDDIRNRINNANAGSDPTGVTASIITYSSNDYRMVLTSDDTGEDGISLQNGSSVDLVELFGWKDANSSVKNSITGGAMSDEFSSSTEDLETLLGLSTTRSGTIQVNGENVSIDLSSDSLEDIKDLIDAVTDVSASIVTDTDGSTTAYRIQVDGTQTFQDDQNILETLGILTNGVSDAQGTSSANTMTRNGENITTDTLITDIDGYFSWTSGDSISISGTDHSSNAVSDSFSITSSSTVQDLMDAIETAYEANGDKVLVHVTSDGTIELEDQEAGAGALAVTLGSSVSEGTLDWGAFDDLDTVRSRELIAGEDATLIVDGVTITSADNRVKEILPGVTLNLASEDSGTTVTLNIDRDLNSIKSKITSFVNAYNEVATYINSQQKYDEESESVGGVLFGDGTLSSVKSDLSSILVEAVWGVSAEFSILGMVGINLDNNGLLEIDSDTLSGFLETNFNDIQQLFAATGTTSTGTLEFISYSQDTDDGEYTVNITQAATQNTSTSDTAVNTTLGSDETLTITEDDSVAEVSLTSDMTISDIVNAINTEMDTVYTEKLVGGTAVTASSSPVTSSTTWNTIDGASLVDDDVISFEGTARGGGSISGSYTISDITSDTIQDLLTEITAAFDSDISASIDSSGQLVLTDNYEGDSQISLIFDYSETTNQVDIFGDVLTTNGDGQEGRFAMAITAINNGSDQLELTNDSYGSDNSFTIEEDTDTGLWTGSQTTPVDVDNGLDVAGTINGEAATGNGQKLTGDEDEASVDGLVIKYTGSSTGDVGEVTFTAGVAELFERTLYNITDSYEGYVAYKQDSLS